MPNQFLLQTRSQATRHFPVADRVTQSNRLLLALISLTVLFLAACDEGGGGSGGGSDSAAAAPAGPSTTLPSTPSAANAITLPPGQIQATLGWAPSAEGEVENYLVYVSRNGSDFTFQESVEAERATVTGTDGDRVQISVIAMNESSQLSNASPPSPQLVFQGPEAQAVTALTETALAPSTLLAGASTVQATSSLEEPAVSAAALEAPEATEPLEQQETELAEEVSEESDAFSESLRELLVRGDARFAVGDLTDDAAAWLQAEVDKQFSAGVSLVGTGRADDDDFRELVWQDSSGQLLVSDGRRVVELDSTRDTPATFEEGLRLQATERFIALEDFDGDAVGDWLIEDQSTGDVSVIDGASFETFDARSTETLGATVAGHGDFDGNGREELVWLQPDGHLQITTPTAPSAMSVDDFEMALDSRLLAVADIDGDGRDDLLMIDAADRLVRALNVEANSGIHFETAAGPNEPIGERSLLVTLDADEDGRSDVAWLANDDFELWDTQIGSEAF